MPFCVEGVDAKFGALEELGLSSEAIGSQIASKVVDDALWGLGPASIDRTEHVVAALTFGNTMEPIADAMGTPNAHDPTSQAMLAVL